jgi:hypothetical protein
VPQVAFCLSQGSATVRVEFAENVKNVHCTTLQAAVLLALSTDDGLSFEQVAACSAGLAGLLGASAVRAPRAGSRSRGTRRSRRPAHSGLAAHLRVFVLRAAWALFVLSHAPGVLWVLEAGVWFVRVCGAHGCSWLGPWALTRAS